MAVSIVTIHHEGAGTPSDDPRGAPGGYTYWIGATQWERLRSVYTSYATLHYNHVSLDICLSGNRMAIDVTDADIALVHGAFLDCHARGEIVDVPLVQLHKDNNGLYMFNGEPFSTVCPGDQAVAKRHQLEAACRYVATPPVPKEIDDVICIQQPHKNVDSHGNLPYAQFAPPSALFPFGAVLLQCGADVAHSVLIGTQRLWNPAPQPGRKWVSMFEHASGNGVALVDDHGATTDKDQGLWA